MMRNMRIGAFVIQILYLWVLINACGGTAFIQVSPGLQDISVANQPGDHLKRTENIQSADKPGPFQRKQLPVTGDETSKILNATKPKAAVEQGSSKWGAFVGVLLAILSVAFLIVLAVKYRFFHRYLGSYRDALLPEEDIASQFSHIGTIAENFPECSVSDRDTYARGHVDDDDDGFIEDNYIEASKRYMTEEQEKEESDDELDIQFSIE